MQANAGWFDENVVAPVQENVIAPVQDFTDQRKQDAENLGNEWDKNIKPSTQDFFEQRQNDADNFGKSWNRDVKQPVDKIYDQANKDLANLDNGFCDIVTLGKGSENKANHKPSPCHSDTGPNAVGGSSDGQTVHPTVGNGTSTAPTVPDNATPSADSSGPNPVTGAGMSASMSTSAADSSLSGPATGADSLTSIPGYSDKPHFPFYSEFAGRAENQGKRGTPEAQAVADNNAPPSSNVLPNPNAGALQTALDAFYTEFAEYYVLPAAEKDKLGIAFGMLDMYDAISSASKSPSNETALKLLTVNTELVLTCVTTAVAQSAEVATLMGPISVMAPVVATPLAGVVVALVVGEAVHYGANYLARSIAQHETWADASPSAASKSP
ncbi:hypothetical protein QF000_005745 [Paraburkholderia atlantica]|uniref:hypothetical protein n=1 Tax=Paraburkholderia atlantica TaxID=2654982 RepID=UPI003D1E04AF